MVYFQNHLFLVGVSTGRSFILTRNKFLNFGHGEKKTSGILSDYYPLNIKSAAKCGKSYYRRSLRTYAFLP